MNTPKLPPLPEPNLVADPCDANGMPTEYYTEATVMRLLAAIEAQGVPDWWLDVLDNFEKKERSPFQAYLAAGLVNELRTAMLASAPPAPQTLAAQGAPDGWQPIETAPKDGTPILLATPKGRIADGNWHQKYGVWSWPYVMVEPTRWMPLPSAQIAAIPQAPQTLAAQGVPDGWQLVPKHRLANARNLVDRGFWVEGAELLDELLASAPPAPQADKAHSLSSAVKTVISAMNEYPDYSWTWHCNVAMAFVDAGGDAYTANQGAARFMRLLAGVEPAYDLPAPQDHGREMGADNCERAIRAMKEQT